MRKVTLHDAGVVSLAVVLVFSLHILIVAPTHAHDDKKEHSDCSICLSAVHQHADSPVFSHQLIIYYCITFFAYIIIQSPLTISILSKRCRAPPVIL